MRHQLAKLFATAALSCCATITLAQQQEVITPARYFQCQIDARQATIDGMQERSATVQRADANAGEKRAAGELARHKVTVALYACGKQDPGALAAYAHRNAEVLQVWLNANPQVQARLDAQAQRIAGLSKQLPAVSPSAKH
jgi:hypothetical protein